MNNSFPNKSTIEEIRKRFDRSVDNYANLETGQRSLPDAALVMELTTEAARRIVPDMKRILDIGCGPGNNTLKMLEKIPNLDCDLLDLSENMLAHAVERIRPRTSGNIRTFPCDFRVADLPENHYHAVFAAAVLHHLRDDEEWKRAFAKLYTITAPGGTVWITDLVTHDHAVIESFMRERYGEYLVSVGGENYRDAAFALIEHEDTPRSLFYQMDLLKKSGFRSVELLHKTSSYVAFGAVK